MNGAKGPSILTWVRFHVDKEIVDIVRKGHQGVPPQLPDAELRQLLSEMRKLAGTNPAMATGGYTGSRTAPRRPNPSRRRSRGRMRRASAATSRRRSRWPTAARGPAFCSGQSMTSAMLLENGNAKFTLLSRDGDVYREKPIAPKRDWLIYDGSLTGNRYSTLDQINSLNVQRLAPVWTLPMPESRPQITPVVVDGIMYVTGWNELHALDATTGRTLWSYKEPRHRRIVSEAGIGVNRGATIVGDRVFMITDHAHVLGFNRFTGAALWAVEMGSYLDSYSATSPPLPVGDLLVVGVAGGEEGARGFLDAYRASTGERVWRFYTIPKRGEPGSETWIGQALEHGCGATWMPGSYDPELDPIYWAIGNPCPDFSRRRTDRRQPVHLERRRPRRQDRPLKWYYQFTPHDTHDWDAVQPMVLADEVWEGKPRKLLFHGDRNGIFYVLDRTNGQVLRTGNLSTKVTWVKGFTPTASRSSIPDRSRREKASPPARAAAAAPIFTPSRTTRSRSCFTCASATAARSTRRMKIRSAREAIAGSAPAAIGEGARGAGCADRRVYDRARSSAPWIRSPRRRSGIFRTPAASPASCRPRAASCFFRGDGGLLVLDGKTGKVLRSSEPRPHLFGRADDLHGGRQAVHRASRHGMLAVYARRTADCRPVRHFCVRTSRRRVAL